MSFFTNMNLARAIILLSILGSAVVGWFGWKKSQELEDMRSSLDVRVPKLAQEIQALADLHTMLTRERDSDGLLGVPDPNSYIRRVGDAKNVSIGDLDVDPSEDKPEAGIVDKKYRIRPSNKERTYQRQRIANFLYKLEESSPRVRVTSIKIDPVQRRLKPHELPDDRWTFEIEVTSRQKEETASAQ